MIAEASTCGLPTGSARRLPVVSLTLFLAAILIYLWPGCAELLQYNGAAVLRTQPWRVLTCQWTHWSAAHLAWDALMFLALAAVCERTDRKAFLHCLAASATLIPLAVALAHPHLQTYCGLSGVDSALFVLLGVQIMRQHHNRDRTLTTAAALALAAFTAKTAYECATGNVLFVQPETTFTPIPLAHVVGGALGLIIASAGAMNRRVGLLPRQHGEAA